MLKLFTWLWRRAQADMAKDIIVYIERYSTGRGVVETERFIDSKRLMQYITQRYIIPAEKENQNGIPSNQNAKSSQRPQGGRD